MMQNLEYGLYEAATPEKNGEALPLYIPMSENDLGVLILFLHDKRGRSERKESQSV
jgi:hypothetical protein